jgi:DNA-binding transcriptional regulator PaaX
LFRGGSPYSYDLNDLARYYLAYDRLMQHWRGVLPDRYFEVSYEQLVQSQSEVTHQLLAYCGLEF